MKKIVSLLLLAMATAMPLGLSAQDSCSITLPYSMNFDNLTTGGSSFVPCWTRVESAISGSATYPNISSVSGHGNVLSFNGNYATSSGTMRAATPLIPAPLNSLELSFVVYKETLRLYAATDPTDQSTYHQIGSYAPGYSGWTTYEVRTDSISGMPSTQGYLVFAANYGGGYGNDAPYLDDVVISALNNCNRPLSVSVDQIGPNEATITWPAVDGVSSYKVYYGTADNIDLASVDTVSGTTLVLDELEPNTLYYVWVKSVCGASAESDPRATSFTTQLSCYPPVGIHQSSTGFNAVSYAWEFDPRGNSATEVLVVLHDLTDSTMEDYEENSSNLNSHFVQDLDPTHEYTISFYSVCGDDTAEVVTLPVVFKVCGQSELAALAGNYDMHPVAVGYNYGYTQMMYPAEVFLDMDTITGLALHRASLNQTSAASVTRTLSIWMGHTTDTSHTAVVPVTGMTQVASDVSYTFPVQEWDTIYFTTPFVYTPGHNVIVTIDDNTGSHVNSSNAQWLWHEQYWKTIYKQDHNTNFNPNSISGATYTQRCPDMQFVGACNTDFSCLAPIVAIGDFDSVMAEVNWLESLGSQWILEYRTSGSTNWILADTVTTAPYFLTGLQPATQYDVRMAVLCDDDEVRYGDVVTFTTLCALMELPFHFTQAQMSAVATSGNSFSSCWSFSQYIMKGHLTDSHRGYVRNVGNGEWIMLPAINADLSGARLRTWAASSTQAQVKVGITSSGNINNVVWVDTLNIAGANPDYATAEYISYLDNYTGEGNRVVLSPIVTNNYHYVYFFDFHLEPIENCRPVEDLALDSASATTLSISWTPRGGATQWAVYCNGQRSVVNNLNHYTITGLNSYTLYNVQVRSLCGNDSSLVVSEHFRTLCAGEQCTFTLNAHASGGEGWKGAHLHIIANGETIEDFTMLQGSDLSRPVSVCAGQPVFFKWYSGNEDDECSFEAVNAAGDTIYMLLGGPGHIDTLFTSADICAEPIERPCDNVHDTLVQEACDSYYWRERYISTSGTYRATEPGVVEGGCDSVYTLILTIYPSSRVEIERTAVTSYTWHGTTYTASGTYTWAGTTIHGCDSTETLHLTLTNGIDEADGTTVTLYPNPTEGVVTIAAESVEMVEVYDVTGRRVLTVRNSNVVDLKTLAAGNYTIRIVLPEGISMHRVLKR